MFENEYSIIQVINKENIGGIERITNDLDSELKNRHIDSRIFQIAPNKFLQYFFKKSILRSAVIGLAVPRLLFLIIVQEKWHRKRNFLIFTHAECHALSKFILLPNRFLPRTRKVISLFQSPRLYPKRILPITLDIIRKSHLVLSYSENVTKLWVGNSNNRVKNLELGIHVPIKKRTSIQLENPDVKLTLLHIGRDIEWKNPLSAAEFAFTLSKLGIEIDRSS